MDHDLIYTKTASGEGAMLQRTRVMQRNVRMVLILVDSQSSVADLCLKTGNPQLTENALRELEKGGFIEPRVDPDSLWAEGRKVAQEVRAAALVSKRIQIAAPRAKAVTLPSASVPPVSADAGVKSLAASDSSAAKEPSIAAESDRVFVDSLAPVLAESAAKNRPEDEEPAPAPGESTPTFVERIKAYFTQHQPRVANSEPVFVESLRPVPSSDYRRDDEAKFPPSGRLTTPLARPAVAVDAAAVLKPLRRSQGESIGWPVIVILSVAAALALMFVAVLLFPYQRYLSDVELAFANACGRSVKVGAMHVDVYPRAALLLRDVRIGAGQDEIRVAEIRLQPAIGTLMAARKVFRDVIVSGVSLPLETIAGLPGVFAALSRQTAGPVIDHLGFEKAAVSFADLGLSGMDGELRRSASGEFLSLVLRSADRSLNVVATPRTNALDVVLEGAAWRPVQGSAFVFDSVNIKGYFADDAFTISSMELRIFEGGIEGRAVLRADKTPSVVGDVSFKRVNAARFGDALGLGQQFGGETTGKMHFSSKAEALASIFSSLDADGEFTMHRGSIRGIDLTEAARSVSNSPIQGGVTAFENLSGNFKLTPTRYLFSGLVLNSGLMQSTGSLEINKQLTTSGTMELKIRGTANQTRVPISISGPLKSPSVQAGRRG